MSVFSNREEQRAVPTLDGWRAVAILGVIACHTQWIVATTSLANYGGLGVQLFFALSGFIITNRLLDEYDRTGSIGWKQFYIRRAFRILPPVFFVLLVLAILGFWLHLIRLDAKSVVSVIFFYRNYIFGGWYTGHFWSLAVEEHFYLLWPTMLCIAGVARGRRVALTMTLVIILWRIADEHFGWVVHHVPLLQTFGQRTDYNISELFCGCYLAFIWRSEQARLLLMRFVKSYWVIPIFTVQLVLLWSRIPLYLKIVEILMAFLPLTTISDPSGKISQILEIPFLRWIGRLSYSLYLWQQLFLPHRFEGTPLGMVQTFPWNWLCIVAAACISYYLVERPFIQLGKRFSRRSAGLQVRGFPESNGLRTLSGSGDSETQ